MHSRWTRQFALSWRIVLPNYIRHD